MKTPFLRTGLNYDTNEVSDQTGLLCKDPTLTQQQFAEECDINEIVRRFGLTGTLPDNYRPPLTGDFTEVIDFQSAMLAVTQAQQRFMEMPPELRYRFNNDPQRLIEFLDNPANRDEADKLGLLRKDVVHSAPPQPPADPKEPKT